MKKKLFKYIVAVPLVLIFLVPLVYAYRKLGKYPETLLNLYLLMFEHIESGDPFLTNL